MKDIVRHQLAECIATMQAVYADEAIHQTLLAIAELTAESMQAGGKLLVAGNGGSAADAQHLAAEFVARLTVDRPALRAIALSTDSSILTAVSNDWAFDKIFSRQIEALAIPGDVFLGISTSGNSKNILRAFEEAKRRGVMTIGFSGHGGGAMRALCDFNIVVPSRVTAHIQEAHLALEHIFCMLVERFSFGIDFDKAPIVPAE